MTPEKWNAYLSICNKAETGGRGDDVTRDPNDLRMQQEFIRIFDQYIGTFRAMPLVLAPGAITEAVMLAQRGYNVHALVLGVDNVRFLDDHKLPNLHARERDAHDLDYPAGTFDGYFSIQVHEHWIAPFVHIGEVRYCLRDGGIVFVDAAGTTNPAMRMIWHTNLVPAQQVREQWEYWGFKVLWEGPEGDNRPQFVFEKLPAGHPEFKNSGYIDHIMKARAAL